MVEEIIEVTIPSDLGRKEVEQGFYRDPHNRRLLYLSKKNDDWYFEFPWTERPILITKKTMPFTVVRVNRGSSQIDEEDKRTIESRLAELAKKKP